MVMQGDLRLDDDNSISPERVSAPFWSRSYKTQLHDAGNPQQQV